MDVLFLVDKGRRWIRTQLNPTGQWPVGKTSSQTGFILIALPCKASHRIHLPPVPDTASSSQKLLPLGRHRQKAVSFLLLKSGFKSIQSQQAGGLLEKTDRKLVFTLLLCPAKQVIESTFHRWKAGHFSDRSCLTTTIFRALRGIDRKTKGIIAASSYPDRAYFQLPDCSVDELFCPERRAIYV